MWRADENINVVVEIVVWELSFRVINFSSNFELVKFRIRVSELYQETELPSPSLLRLWIDDDINVVVEIVVWELSFRVINFSSNFELVKFRIRVSELYQET